MKLNEIEELKPLVVAGDTSIEFTGVNCDSRLVRRGDIFVAVEGWKEDGAKYVCSARERGAVGVITSRDPASTGGESVQVSDARMALAMIASALNNWPARKMDVFSVTGTNGKTTTAWLLCEMLKESGRNTGLFTTVSVEYSGREIPAMRTTPDACALQRLLADMQRDGCDSVVMESSSHALHQSRVAGIPFKGGIFTNLSRDHLDYHLTMDQYFESKFLMFRQMAELNPGAVAVCCIDNEYGVRMAEAVAKLPLKCITAGFSEKADLAASSLEATTDGNSFVLDGCGAEKLRIHTALAGRYNVQNVACASAVAAEYGVSWSGIASAIERVQPKWGRFERVPLAGSGFSAFVDYAHTDDALRNVLSTLREITDGRLIVVFGCGGDRDKTKRPLMGSVGAELADIAIVTSDNPRTEDAATIIEDILDGIQDRSSVSVCEDRREAIRLALKTARSGDVVLAAGKGHECFQVSAGRSVPFDDRKVIQEEAAALL